MKSYEYKRVYHPQLGKIVYQHKGTGLIIDNIFKPLSKLASTVKPLAAVLKPLAKKAIKDTEAEALTRKIEKMVDKKAGDFLMKSLHSSTKASSGRVKSSKGSSQEDYNIILNRLISGSGVKKQKKQKKSDVNVKR